MVRATIYGICLLFAISCSQKKPERRNRINRISFATGGCHGECPLLFIEMDSTLAYHFYGGQYATQHSYYTGTITHQIWDSINTSFERLHFLTFDSMYNTTVDDPVFEFILHYDGRTKKVWAHEMSLPAALRGFCYDIVDSYRFVALKPSPVFSMEIIPDSVSPPPPEIPIRPFHMPHVAPIYL